MRAWELCRSPGLIWRVVIRRFAIDADVDWNGAEAARAASGDKSKSSVVSVKSTGGASSKRKRDLAEPTDGTSEGNGASKKKVRRGKKAMRG